MTLDLFIFLLLTSILAADSKSTYMIFSVMELTFFFTKLTAANFPTLVASKLLPFLDLSVYLNEIVIEGNCLGFNSFWVTVKCHQYHVVVITNVNTLEGSMFGSIDGALKCSEFTIKTILAMYFSYRERHIVFPDNLIVNNVFANC